MKDYRLKIQKSINDAKKMKPTFMLGKHKTQMDEVLFENHTREMKQILTNSIDYIECANYLNKPATEKEIEFLRFNSSFYFIRLMAEQLLIIEIYKLFSKSHNDKYSFYYLFEYLRANNDYYDFALKDEVIDNWIEIIESKKEIISILKFFRDKFYSHTDIDRFYASAHDDRKYENTFSRLHQVPIPIYDEIYSLIQLAIEILRQVFGEILNIKDEKFHRIFFNLSKMREIIIVLADNNSFQKLRPDA